MDNLKNSAPAIIAIEGVDGCGKSTLTNAIQERLDNEGIRNRRVAMLAHSPARDLLLSNADYTPRERLLLIGLCAIEAARQCREALRDGCWVLLERSELTRTVYQSMTDGLVTECRNLNSIIGDFPHVSYMVFMDTTFERAQENLILRGDELDVIEKMGAQYHQRVYNNYHTVMHGFEELQKHYMLCKMPYTEVIRVDASLPPKLNTATILYGVNDFISIGN